MLCLLSHPAKKVAFINFHNFNEGESRHKLTMDPGLFNKRPFKESSGIKVVVNKQSPTDQSVTTKKFDNLFDI